MATKKFNLEVDLSNIDVCYMAHEDFPDTVAGELMYSNYEMLRQLWVQVAPQIREQLTPDDFTVDYKRLCS